MDNESRPIFNPKTGKQLTPGPLSEPTFRELVARVLKQSLKDRLQVAAELSTLTGERITPKMLNDWLAPSKAKVRFPGSLVKAFCELIGDDRPVRALLPDHLEAALAIGEKTAQCAELLRQALAELEKLPKAVPQKKPQRRSKR